MAKPTITTDDFTKIQLSGVHVELTPAMQTIMREKFAVLLRHNQWIVRLNVRLHQDQTLGSKYHYNATAQIELRGPDIIATVKGENAYAAVDALVEKLDEQLRERHERVKDKRNRPHGVEFETDIPKTGTED